MNGKGLFFFFFTWSNHAVSPCPLCMGAESSWNRPRPLGSNGFLVRWGWSVRRTLYRSAVMLPSERLTTCTPRSVPCPEVWDLHERNTWKVFFKWLKHTEFVDHKGLVSPPHPHPQIVPPRVYFGLTPSVPGTSSRSNADTPDECVKIYMFQAVI